MKHLKMAALASIAIALVTSTLYAEVSAPTSLKDLLGENFVNAQGEKVGFEALQDKSVIGLYFSAHWCPPCRAFTPKLVEAANKFNADGKPFQIVFVSSDRTEEAMLGYMTEYKMPWLSLPFKDAKAKELSARYKVRGIPSLVIIDANGNTITKNGRGPVAQKGDAAFEEWANTPAPAL